MGATARVLEESTNITNVMSTNSDRKTIEKSDLWNHFLKINQILHLQIIYKYISGMKRKNSVSILTVPPGSAATIRENKIDFIL